MCRRFSLVVIFLLNSFVRAQAPTTAPVGKFPGVEVNVQQKQVRIACQSLRVEAPLEFFCVVAGTSEHESVLRTAAKPSHIHTALLMLGLEPGPPLSISVEFQKDGKTVTLPAHKLMRDLHTKKPMPPTTWIFAGSRVMPDG